MMSSGWSRWVGVLVLTLSCQRAPISDVANKQGAVVQTCNPGTACSFLIKTPAALAPDKLVMSTTSWLKIDDRVVLKEPNGAPATLAHLGTGTLQVGTDARLGDIWSLGPVTLADRTRVDGTIHGKVTITTGNNVFIKAKDPKTFSTQVTTSSITFPSPVPAGLGLEPGATGVLTPGAYGAIVVKTNAVLRISAGSYLMDSLDLEPSGTLALDTTAGPVRFYIRTDAILRGIITSPGGAQDLSLVYFGANALHIEMPLKATVISANATINVKSVGTLSGAYFAPSVEVFPDDVVTHVATQVPVIAKRTGRVEAETFDAAAGGHVAGGVVDQLSGGLWLLYRGFDFGAPGQFNRIRLNVISPTGVDQIVVRVDSLTGPIAGSLQTLETGPGYIVETTPLIPPVSGVHDTYVIFNGSESAGIDWFELGKSPTQKVTARAVVQDLPGNDHALPPPGPGEEETDFVDNTKWLDLPRNVQIPPHSGDGYSLDLKQTAELALSLTWTGGTGAVGVTVYDQANNPITPRFSRLYPGENRLLVVTGALTPQKLSVVVRNDGDAMITSNLQNGFAPTP